MKLQKGTIFSYVLAGTTTATIFVATGENGLANGVVGYSPSYTANCVTNSKIKILNDSYVLSGMTVEEIYVDYVKQHNAAMTKLQEEVDKLSYNAAYAIKPSEKKKEFYFNSHYTPQGLRIVVGKKPGESTPYFSINDSKLTSTEINYLDVLANGSVATMKIAATTIMIGTVIGQTATLGEAVQEYYKLLQKK